MEILIVGGSDAGISAALRARELDPSSEVVMVLKDAYPNFSICGIPFYLGGEVSDWRHLAHRTRQELLDAGIALHTETTALAVDVGGRRVALRGPNGPLTRAYDALILATGAEPVRPGIPGADLSGVFVLHDMDEAFALESHLERPHVRRVAIVGAGYIGCEMAESLTRRGLEVTLLERAPTVLPTVDPPLGGLIGERLRQKGLALRTGVRVTGIRRRPGGSLTVEGDPGVAVTVDVVLLVAGVRPRTALLESAGLTPGVRGAIPVERTMATAAPCIFAAGDCVETYHRLLDRPTYLPLGTTAHKQGRVAGENAVGGHQLFAGSLGTQAVKIFDVVAARTGLNDADAARAGFDPLTAAYTGWDHKVYYPGAEDIHILLTGDRRTRRLLGAQMLGRHGTEVSKRIDILAASIYNGMTVDAVMELDLSYTPPLSSPWDPVQTAAEAWCRTAGRPAT